jgi:hypothetical protein
VDTDAGSGVFSTPAVLSVDALVCFFDGLAGLDRLARVTVIFFGEPFPCKMGFSLCTGVPFRRIRRVLVPISSGRFDGVASFVPDLSFCSLLCFVVL